MFDQIIANPDVEEEELELYLCQDSENGFSMQKPDWLLSDWDDDAWILSGRNGSTTEPVIIRWKSLLPNGLMLTDPKYSAILESTKQLIVAVRIGSTARITRSVNQKNLALYLKSIIRWMIIRGMDKQPVPYMTYSMLTPSDFNDFCKSLDYGMISVEDYKIRISDYLDNLNKTDFNLLLDKSGLINRSKLGRKIHINPKNLYSPSLLKLFDKYEPHDSTRTDFIISRRAKNREYISNRAMHIDEATKLFASETVISDYLRAWSYLYELSGKIDNLIIENPFRDHTRNSILESINHTPKGRTPNIPIDMALYYLNSAIEWVVKYGPDLVKYKKLLDISLDAIMEKRTSRRDYYAPQAFNSVEQPSSLKSLNIRRYHRNATGSSSKVIRDNLSVDESIECLTAACFVLITTFTARRREEVLNLNPDCTFNDYSGSMISFQIQKASANHILETVARPIPALITMAVSVMSKLSLHLNSRSNCSHFDRLLFITEGRNGLTRLKDSLLLSRLDLFADIIEVPTFYDSKYQIHRRWYLRPHEARRFFAYTYYWNSSETKLDTLSWFMGHLDLSETERYITDMVSGSELPNAITTLCISAMQYSNPNNDLVKLKEAACEYFQVENINFIPDTQLEKFISHLSSTGHINIEIINTPSSTSGKAICVHYLENANA